MTLWQIDVYPREDQADREAERLSAEASDLGIVAHLPVKTARGYLVEGDLSAEDAAKLARELLADPLVHRTTVATTGSDELARGPAELTQLIHVLPKPGVMDPVANSALSAAQDLGVAATAVRTFRKYWTAPLPPDQLDRLCVKLLSNDSVEQVVLGPLQLDRLEVGSPSGFQLVTIPIRTLDDAALVRLSRDGQLYLTLVEMQTIQAHFRQLDRDPTDIELESIAQTWSEHCSHKTLAGRIAYEDENGSRHFENMLKETIFAATQQIRRSLGDRDWCVSVFKDNAGVVKFDDDFHAVFKVETHNHPSALEPYGGANTGIGGVIRDPLGTGLGAKPVCNTDVFCFAPPDTPLDALPPGVLHPRRIMKGVVSGVRDYGNRMGIPTVNGAIYFDERYVGNPLVYCGTVGMLPCGKTEKRPLEGDWIVAIGGRTGRDGIHGATFSSAELTSESESVSGGAVQIGNAITEKMVLDVLLKARDEGLYHAVTDCGAGGFSSAVGEMGEDIGAEVWLERAPLKYDGLTYTEIWISEAQERMVLAVPPVHWERFRVVCEAENVEATILGKFVATGRLRLLYNGHEVGDLSMDFLHGGRPPVIRDAVYRPQATPGLRSAVTGASVDAVELSEQLSQRNQAAETLRQLMGCLNISSKEWVIRQYDHEVQGGSVIKPLVGVQNDGPSDAAVVRPRLDSYQGLVISCGMNPRFGDFDTYHMAASAIDEALRNCVAVGADPDRIAILDNFCWGSTDRPETLGSLVRAAIACHDLAIALNTPFISGKDSLNNEFRFEKPDGTQETIAIPSSLLISAMGQVADVRSCITMDLKTPGNRLYLVGLTRNELGGSHFTYVKNLAGGDVPRVDASLARSTFRQLHRAIQAGLVRACHDLSEGGLAVAIAEMAFAGGCGATLWLDGVPMDEVASSQQNMIALFAESNTRFLCEVPDAHATAFENAFDELPLGLVGRVTDRPDLLIYANMSQATEQSDPVLQANLAELKEAWQKPLRW